MVVLLEAHLRYMQHSLQISQQTENDTIPESTTEKGKEKIKKRGKGSLETQRSLLPTKELILLPSPEYKKVPRFQRKRKLQELGLIVDGLPFNKSWDETQLQMKVTN